MGGTRFATYVEPWCLTIQVSEFIPPPSGRMSAPYIPQNWRNSSEWSVMRVPLHSRRGVPPLSVWMTLSTGDHGGALLPHHLDLLVRARRASVSDGSGRLRP